VQIDLSQQVPIRQCKEMFVKESQSIRQFRASSKSLPARDLAPIEFCFTKAGFMVIGREGLYLRRPKGTQN
jgi:hypothetical protein